MTLLIESQLFPPIDAIKKSILYKHIKIDQYEHFQKMSFRNRYIIAGANGLGNLTIPILGGREQKTRITEIEINNKENWQIRHWRSIASAYKKAPYFDFYSSSVEALIFSDEKNLFAFNLAILKWVFKVLKTEVVMELTDSYQELFIEGEDLRNRFLPKNFQDNRENWQPRYSQVFEDRLGFQPNLSILDLLFCEGPNAIHLLNQ